MQSPEPYKSKCAGTLGRLQECGEGRWVELEKHTTRYLK